LYKLLKQNIYEKKDEIGEITNELKRHKIVKDLKKLNFKIKFINLNLKTL
jgi:hypothetical protein